MKLLITFMYAVAVVALVLYFRSCTEHFADAGCVGSTCATEGEMSRGKYELPPDSNPPPPPPPPPPALQPPLKSNVRLRLKDPVSGKYVTYTGGVLPVNATVDKATTFTVQNNPSVFNNAAGGVALQVTGGPNTNNGYLRHAGYTCWSHGFNANNYDFSWRFDKTADVTKFVLYNWFGGGTFLDIVNGNLQITGNRKEWIVEEVK